MALQADDTAVTVTGVISDLSGPSGDLRAQATKLDMARLLAFVGDFTAGAGVAAGAPATAASAPRASTPAVPSTMNIRLALEADSVSMGDLLLTRLSGKATVAAGVLALNPVRFGVFGGQYQGSLRLTPGDVLRFEGSSTLSGVDMAAVARFGGSADTITGRLAGRIDFAGTGADASGVLGSTSGRGRVDVTDGVVRNLGLLGAVVAATSMRAGSLSEAVTTAARAGSKDEPFSRLGASFDIVGGNLRTSDLRLESRESPARGSGRRRARFVDAGHKGARAPVGGALGRGRARSRAAHPGPGAGDAAGVGVRQFQRAERSSGCG